MATKDHAKTCPICREMIDNPGHNKGRWLTREEAKEMLKELAASIRK